MNKVCYVMAYRPSLPYLILIKENVVNDITFRTWATLEKSNADARGESIIILENLPTVYLKEKVVANHSVYEFVDNNVSGEAWLK